MLFVVCFLFSQVRTVQTGALDGGDEEYYGPLDEFAGAYESLTFQFNGLVEL